MILLKKLFLSIDKKRQLNAILLIFAMTLSSVAELISVALFAPFISIILGNEEVQNGKLFLLINKYADSKNIILLIITLFVISLIIRIFTLIWQNKFAAIINNEIIYKAYDVVLNQDYPSYIKQSKSKQIAIIHTFGNYLLSEIIIPILYLFESIIFVLFVNIFLLLYSWKIFLSIVTLLFIIYFFFYKRANKILKSSSQKQVKLNEKLLERLDVELDSIEYIHLGNYQRICSMNYAKYDKEYKLNLANYFITANLPRILIEYLILIIVLLIILFLYVNNNFSSTLPILAAGALLAQKSFPYLQKIFLNWSILAQYKQTALSILNYSIKYEINKKYRNENLRFINFQEIKFKDVNFSYKKNYKVLNNINFSIKKGDKVAIMGASGSGKTTLLRLICGLLHPSSGKVLVNNKEINKSLNEQYKVNWMRTIGYVPQKINLTGKTLRENITFKNNKNTKNKIKIEDVIKITLLEDLVARCNGLDSDIFQSSFSLSGGENQRLAIARALFHNPELLIMDEPTSSLDIKTQKQLFINLQNLTDLTCIVITHRVETKHFFDKILEINGQDLSEKIIIR